MSVFYPLTLRFQAVPTNRVCGFVQPGVRVSLSSSNVKRGNGVWDRQTGLVEEVYLFISV